MARKVKVNRRLTKAQVRSMLKIPKQPKVSVQRPSANPNTLIAKSVKQFNPVLQPRTRGIQGTFAQNIGGGVYAAALGAGKKPGGSGPPPDPGPGPGVDVLLQENTWSLRQEDGSYILLP